MHDLKLGINNPFYFNMSLPLCHPRHTTTISEATAGPRHSLFTSSHSVLRLLQYHSFGNNTIHHCTYHSHSLSAIRPHKESLGQLLSRFLLLFGLGSRWVIAATVRDSSSSPITQIQQKRLI